MIVVDTNVIASCFIERSDSTDARAALEKDPDWRVPPLWRSELLSVLRHELHGKGTMTRSVADGVWTQAELLFGHREVKADPDRVLTLASKALLSYDAEFLAVAAQLGTVVITNDQQFIKAAGGVALSLRAFLTM